LTVQNVIRLVTVVGVRGRPSSPREMSLSALHLAVLDDGRRLTLLDDRGWTESGPSDIWHHTSREEIEATARTVVGPDEPSGHDTAQHMATTHWEHLAGVLHRHGVQADARELSNLPHEVELSDRVVARLTD